MNQGMILEKKIYNQGFFAMERLTFNQGVTGSNPVGLTIYPKGLAIKRWAFCFLIRMGFAHNSQFANRLSCYIVGASR